MEAVMKKIISLLILLSLVLSLASCSVVDSVLAILENMTSENEPPENTPPEN
jgi:hypothetical protein